MRNPSATEQLIAAIEKERALPATLTSRYIAEQYNAIHGQNLDRGILPNSQDKPKYSVVVYLVVGGLITVSMLTGVALGWVVGK